MLGFQQNGWMVDVIGETWFIQVFLSNCGPYRTQLLILDGHWSGDGIAENRNYWPSSSYNTLPTAARQDRFRNI